jgi:hypothetical protein
LYAQRGRCVRAGGVARRVAARRRRAVVQRTASVCVGTKADAAAAGRQDE